MIIAIDGLDGSGKETTCNVLRRLFIDNLQKPECTVVVHSFPDYTTPSGREIKNVLSDSVFKNVDRRAKSYMVATLFALNRAEHFALMENPSDIFDPDYIHIFDRYWASNILYQGLGSGSAGLLDFIPKCKAIDEIFRNPMPYLYYFLKLPFSVLQERLAKRNVSKSGDYDSYEETNFQLAVYHLSEYILERNNLYNIYNAVIDGAPIQNGFPKQKSVDEIATEIYTDAINRLGNVVKATS